MKGFFLIATLLLAQYLFAQQDSTDIKLQLYKDYLDKGLVNQQDYESLKAKLLHLGKFTANQRHKTNSGDFNQYDKKITFELRIEPVAFFDLKAVYREAELNYNTGKVYSDKQLFTMQQYGGMQIGIGAAVRKQYHVHFMMGFDGNKLNQFFTIGADCNINLLPGRFSPFVHIGTGYMCVTGNSDNSTARYDQKPPLNGGYAVSGIGLYARVTRFFAINISPDYRFIYGTFKKELYDYNSKVTIYGRSNLFYHQIGLRVAAIFY